MFRRVGAAAIGTMVAALLPARVVGHATVLQLVVRVYGTAKSSSTEMGTAQMTASGVFKRAGIDVVWVDCRASPRPDLPRPQCDRPVGPSEVIVQIVDAASNEAANTLGYASVHIQGHFDCLATVLADRVDATADRTQADRGKLLGRVIAHEIAHLLLETTAHSSSGLMRARWPDDEIRRDRPLDWMLSGSAAKQVRLGLLARSAL